MAGNEPQAQKTNHLEKEMESVWIALEAAAQLKMTPDPNLAQSKSEFWVTGRTFPIISGCIFGILLKSS